MTNSTLIASRLSLLRVLTNPVVASFRSLTPHLTSKAFLSCKNLYFHWAIVLASGSFLLIFLPINLFNYLHDWPAFSSVFLKRSIFNRFCKHLCLIKPWNRQLKYNFPLKSSVLLPFNQRVAQLTTSYYRVRLIQTLFALENPSKASQLPQMLTLYLSLKSSTRSLN